MTRNENGALLVWNPTVTHQVNVSAIFAIKDPNIIDLDLSVEGHAFYPDYELLFSNHVADRLNGGLFVRRNDFTDEGEYERIGLTDNPAFHGMYPFFPRDEHAAHGQVPVLL